MKQQIQERSSLGTKMICLFWVSRVLDTRSTATRKCLIGIGCKGLEVKEESLDVGRDLEVMGE